MIKTYHRQHEWGWLAVLAAAPPSSKDVVWGLHPNGLGAHMLRTATISRFFLQHPLGDRLEDWPAERIWWELDKRLAIDEPWTLRHGQVIETDIVDMRSYVTAPMQHGSLFLTGDAAHIVPPVLPKGANLALADAAVLAPAMARLINQGDGSALAAYSSTRLPDIWQAQAFARWMLELVCAQVDGSPFTRQLQHAWIAMLHTSASARRWFAEHYVGGIDGIGGI